MYHDAHISNSMGKELECYLISVAGARAACLKTAYATLALPQFCRSGAELVMPAYLLLDNRARVGGWASFFISVKLGIIYMLVAVAAAACSNLLSRLAAACIMMRI